MEPVRNHRSKSVVDASRLHRAKHRRETGRSLLEGPNLISDAVASGARLHLIFATEDDPKALSIAAKAGVDVYWVDERGLQRLAGTETPRGPIAVVEIEAGSPEPESDLLVAWGVSDPGNVGTLIRTAAAYGWSFAHVPGTADPWSPKCLRSGAAGQFQTSITAVRSLDDLAPRRVVASVVEGGEPPTRISRDPIALLIGEEASGLPAAIVQGADRMVTIATTGATESLNAAVAAGILVHELSKAPGQPQHRV
ncbi:MAG: RNA methyltransferase [Actinomycetota bacterium]|nr:RNA methyltransferase [Actinomycetota bacterium]